MAISDIATSFTLISALVLLVSIAISSVAFHFVVRGLNFKIHEYKYALLAAVICGILGLALSALLALLALPSIISSIVSFVLGIAIYIAVVRYIYKVDWITSIKAAVIIILASLIIGVLFLYMTGVF